MHDPEILLEWFTEEMETAEFIAETARKERDKYEENLARKRAAYFKRRIAAFIPGYSPD